MKNQEQTTIRIDSLPTESIRGLQRQLGQQLEAKRKAAEVLASTANAFSQSKNAVEDLSKLSDGDKLMVPLTESIYVEGFIFEKDSLLTDIGTGYFAERTCAETIDFCDRKINTMKEHIDDLGEDLKSKEQAIAQMESVLQDRAAAESVQTAGDSGTSGP